jgi:IS30 family transposase
MSYSHLTTKERYTIELLKARGESIAAIAATLERRESTIRRELKRFGKGKKYDHKKASRAAKKRRSVCSNGPRINSETKKYVVSKLKQLWSPEQIEGTLRLRKKGLRLQLVSTKWIYNFVRKDRKAGGILWTYLRCQKIRRKKYGTGLSKRGTIPGRVDISERPKIVDKRIRFGDWEGDTMIGAGHHQAIISLVDRRTRYAILIKVNTKKATVVTPAIIQRLLRFRANNRTITFDNGTEFSDHKSIKRKLKVDVYFARPYASYERGSNENTNGLVRQRFPKKTSFAIITKRALKKFENLLNNRPRKCIGFRTPAEMLKQSIK